MVSSMKHTLKLIYETKHVIKLRLKQTFHGEDNLSFFTDPTGSDFLQIKIIIGFTSNHFPFFIFSNMIFFFQVTIKKRQKNRKISALDIVESRSKPSRQLHVQT